MTQLSPDDEELACELASGKSHQAAGEAVGLSRKTVWRRMDNPLFAERVRELRRALTEDASCHLTRITTDSIARLHLLCMNSEDEWVQLKAAELILTQMLKFTERGDIEARIRRLEGLSGDGTAGPTRTEDDPAKP